tara:strand:+ start:4212 stop:7235 length:3024 start_codon:yes stop_codon:yes gene_type:complete
MSAYEGVWSPNNGLNGMELGPRNSFGSIEIKGNKALVYEFVAPRTCEIGRIGLFTSAWRHPRFGVEILDSLEPDPTTLTEDVALPDRDVLNPGGAVGQDGSDQTDLWKKLASRDGTGATNGTSPLIMPVRTKGTVPGTPAYENGYDYVRLQSDNWRMYVGLSATNPDAFSVASSARIRRANLRSWVTSNWAGSERQIRHHLIRDHDEDDSYGAWTVGEMLAPINTAQPKLLESSVNVDPADSFRPWEYGTLNAFDDGSSYDGWGWGTAKWAHTVRIWGTEFGVEYWTTDNRKGFYYATKSQEYNERWGGEQWWGVWTTHALDSAATLTQGETYYLVLWSLHGLSADDRDVSFFSVPLFKVRSYDPDDRAGRVIEAKIEPNGAVYDWNYWEGKTTAETNGHGSAFPFLMYESPVTVTANLDRTGTTATVTETAHGLEVGQAVTTYLASGQTDSGSAHKQCMDTHVITSKNANDFTFETATSGTVTNRDCTYRAIDPSSFSAIMEESVNSDNGLATRWGVVQRQFIHKDWQVDVHVWMESADQYNNIKIYLRKRSGDDPTAPLEVEIRTAVEGGGTLLSSGILYPEEAGLHPNAGTYRLKGVDLEPFSPSSDAEYYVHLKSDTNSARAWEILSLSTKIASSMDQQDATHNYTGVNYDDTGDMDLLDQYMNDETGWPTRGELIYSFWSGLGRDDAGYDRLADPENLDDCPTNVEGRWTGNWRTPLFLSEAPKQLTPYESWMIGGGETHEIENTTSWIPLWESEDPGAGQVYDWGGGVGTVADSVSFAVAGPLEAVQRPSRACRFTTDGYISFPNHADYAPGQTSISCAIWARCRPKAEWTQSPFNNQYLFSLSNGTGAAEYGLRMRGASDDVVVEVASVQKTRTEAQIQAVLGAANFEIGDFVWHRYIFNADRTNDEVSIWIDGQLIATWTTAGITAIDLNDAGDFYVGCQGAGTPAYFFEGDLAYMQIRTGDDGMWTDEEVALDWAFAQSTTMFDTTTPTRTAIEGTRI